MSRKLIVTIHLYLAALFAPAILIMAITGGSYLMGWKGSTEQTEVARLPEVQLPDDADQRAARIRTLLAEAGLDSDFEYVKTKGNKFQTRPSSSTHYLLTQESDVLVIERVNPDFLASLIELHKGHGPGVFRIYEQILALVLVLVMLSGLYVGYMTKAYRRPTLIMTGTGLLLFAGLAWL